MKILGPTRFHRLNEAGALVFLFAGLFFMPQPDLLSPAGSILEFGLRRRCAPIT